MVKVNYARHREVLMCYDAAIHALAYSVDCLIESDVGAWSATTVDVHLA